MLRTLVLLLITAGAVHAQAGDALLSQLIEEVRQMRRELGVMSLTAQRMQLVLFRLQLQQEAVRKAQQRYDVAASRVSYLDRIRNQGQDGLRQLEARIEAEKDPTRKRQMETELEMTKRQFQRTAQDEPQIRAEQADAERDLRLEQARVQELQQRLDEMEKTLERLAAPPQRPAGNR